MRRKAAGSHGVPKVGKRFPLREHGAAEPRQVFRRDWSAATPVSLALLRVALDF